MKAILALEVPQGPNPSKTQFIAAISLADLIDEANFRVDVRQPHAGRDEDVGYQRSSREPHARKIARAIAAGERQPQNILLNARQGIKKLRNVSGNLWEIEPEKFPFWIVDGQHRVLAGKIAHDEFSADIDDYFLPVTIMNATKVEEMIQFRNLNTLQMRAKTELAEQLIRDESRQLVGDKDLSTKEKLAVRALNIMDEVLKSESWQGKIALANEEMGPGRTIRQGAFTNGLRPILTQTRLKDESVPVQDVAKLVVDYWEAIRRAFPTAANNPKEYNIQKNVGVAAFHWLLVEILLRNSYPTKDDLYSYLKSIRENYPQIDDEFFRKGKGGAGNFSSEKGFKSLGLLMASHVNFEQAKTVAA